MERSDWTQDKLFERFGTPETFGTIGTALSHAEGHWVAEQGTQPRLSIGYLFHRSDAYHVFAIAKTWGLSM
jgi:hypothetical protein